ncbi:unknown protein [Seminavis robusta]|uniref:Uncharacterized protein n=1 Tax=Seminavis robusta TaxID=568900 RepID=A0A9N8ER17_9STRA|nr:unknown protein [Seminavis robusta]|eukprot:Sro1449_g273710.1 n/a (976) ;mRNA; f:21894-24821
MAKSIVALFQKNTEIQSCWWLLSTAVNVCHRLANFHPKSPLIEGSYGLQFTFETALAGLQQHNCVDAGSMKNRSKEIYIHTFKETTAVYADFSAAVPWIPPLAVSDTPRWLNLLEMQRLSIRPYLPLGLYKLCNFWYSTEAEKLFGAREDETAEEAARNLQAILIEGVKTAGAAKDLIVGLATDDPPTYFIDNYDGELLELKFDPARVDKLVHAIQIKSYYLLRAITLMLEADAENEPLCWKGKCEQAMVAVQANTRDKSISNYKAIQEWLRQFREHRRFNNPLMRERIGISLFVNHPEAATEMRDHGNQHIQQLSVDFMQAFLRSNLIPKLAAKEHVSVEEFLLSNGLKNICCNTTHRWLTFLGFKRSLYKKGFYTDIHERPDVVSSRIEYCIELMKLELHSAVWVQLLPFRVQQLKETNRIYPNNDGVPILHQGQTLFEFHVDDIVDSHNLPELQGNRFGGNYSLRLPANASRTIVWGQDEVVSNEKAMNSMAWYGSEGQQALRPKDLGCSIMISGVVSREAGWMPIPTPEQLRLINANRAGKDYVARDAAIVVQGSAAKRPFTEKDIQSRCCRWPLHPGQNNEGYWTNNHTIVQLENIADMAAVMYPHHNHVICYDHSQGHTAKWKDGLDASRLNKEPGGQQPKMHETTLTEGCLGPFDNNGCRLSVGAVQRCVFSEDDQGPSWMSSEQQSTTKYDQEFEGETATRALRSKKEIHAHLIHKLGSNTAGLPSDPSRTSLAFLRDIANQHCIDLSVEEVKKQKGWVNTPKGALQMCIERGLVDLELVKRRKGHYTMPGRKDAKGKLIEGTSLRMLLQGCDDFKKEISMLEWVAEQYGWRVIFSPKCHPEIAGVGIEYVWSVSKNCLVRIPLPQRKGKDRFTKQVLDVCFHSEKTLTKQTVRGCARKARQFVIAYLLLHAVEAATDEGTGGTKPLTGEVSIETMRKKQSELKFATIRAAQKMYKRHRGIVSLLCD